MMCYDAGLWCAGVCCGVPCSACKADLALLPPLVRRLRRLPFTAQHAQQYNDLIEVRGTILHAKRMRLGLDKSALG